MSRRAALSIVTGVILLGGAGVFAFAQAAEQPLALTHSTARYTAPDGDRAGSLAFVTDVTAPSDVKSVKVLAWPQNSSFAKKGLTAKDMAAVEQADCTSSGQDTMRCTYTAEVTGADAESFPRGSWHVAVLATAQDGTTILDTEAAGFIVR
ncbi:DUF5707 domain-containing protein [Streptomyces sp. NPDC002403]